MLSHYFEVSNNFSFTKSLFTKNVSGLLLSIYWSEAAKHLRPSALQNVYAHLRICFLSPTDRKLHSGMLAYVACAFNQNENSDKISRKLLSGDAMDTLTYFSAEALELAKEETTEVIHTFN